MKATVDSDPVWKALADPTRRALLDALAAGPRTTGELIQRFPELCRTAVMKHLDVLEAAGLLIVRREGRLRWNRMNPIPIQRIYERWVKKHVRGLAASMTRLKDHVESRASRGEAASRTAGRSPGKPRKKT